MFRNRIGGGVVFRERHALHSFMPLRLCVSIPLLGEGLMQSRKVFQKGLPLHGLSFCRQILFLVFYPVAPKQFRNTLCRAGSGG